MLIVERNGNQVRMMYFRDNGVETATILCDGLEHPQSLFKTQTYRAQLKDNSVLISSRVNTCAIGIADVFPHNAVSTEAWVLSADGTELTIHKSGEFTSYRRPTLWEWIGVKIP